MGARGAQYKPGYIASTAGATLEIEVDSVFPELSNSTTVPVVVVISYTQSYDGWGTAQVRRSTTCDVAYR